MLTKISNLHVLWPVGDFVVFNFVGPRDRDGLPAIEENFGFLCIRQSANHTALTLQGISSTSRSR